MTTVLAQISDTHLSASRPWFRANFDLVAEHVRGARPDLVVNTGDLSLDGADNEADLREALDAHAALGLETRLLPGNHDVGDHLDVARRQPVNEARLARYRALAGDDSWAFDVPGWRLVGLNALSLGTGLSGDGEQLAAVRRAAETLNGRALAILLHKPLADLHLAEAGGSNRFMTSAPRAALLDALGPTRPSLVLCGHVHQYRDGWMEGARHVWGPATSFVISDPWQPGYGAKAVGYLLHEFDADGRHRHRLVPVRGLVHHDLVAFPAAYGDIRAWGEGNA